MGTARGLGGVDEEVEGGVVLWVGVVGIPECYSSVDDFVAEDHLENVIYRVSFCEKVEITVSRS